MNYDIRNYVKVFNDVLDQKTCASIIDELQYHVLEKHSWSDNGKNQYVYDGDIDVSFTSTSFDPLICERIQNITDYYCSNVVNSDNWFNRCDFFTAIRYNIYKERTKMANHCDHIHSIFDGEVKGVPILSMVGLLNDKFKGGNLVMWGDYKVPLVPGSIVVFPSNFMFPHQVTEITNGVRYSFVSWGW